MKPTRFDGNGNGLFVEHHRTREGPNFFVVSYKGQAQIRVDPKDAWRVLGSAKHTDSGKALKEWAVETAEACLPTPEPRKDTSFASEAVAEEAVEDPTTNTKMVM